MSLQIKQSISLAGTSSINGKQVATFNTSVAADQAFQNVSMNITDQELYDTNKAEVRKDRDSFQDKVDAVADSLDAEQAQPTDTTPA